MNNIKQEIINDINDAKISIKIAVSWMTDTDLINLLLKKKQNNEAIHITILLSEHTENRNYGEKFKNLISNGIKVNTWGSDNPQKGNFLHCKFYIIDDLFAKSGSYNWSFSATKNAECLDLVPLDDKLRLFNRLLKNSIDMYFLS